MKIGIDLSITAVNQAGSGQYTRNLIEAMDTLLPPESLVTFSVRQQRIMSAQKTIRSRMDTLYRDLWWTHVILPRQSRQAGVDLLHMPSGIIPFATSCPVVVTILDTILFQMPHLFPAWQRLYFRLFGPFSAHRSSHILTISNQSRQDIIRTFRVPQEKVTVTFPAADPQFKVLPGKVTDYVKKSYHLDQYILMVGTIEPRKNIIRTLEAYALLRHQGLDYPLVHAGPQGWLNEDLPAKIKHLGLDEKVRFLGHIPLPDLVALYNGASVLIYPSLYEGFGLPPLEGMACGCPVVTSNISSLPEVVGDAALTVSPFDIDGMADALRNVLVSPDLAADLRLRGLKRAAAFSWENCARETINVYKSVAQ